MEAVTSPEAALAAVEAQPFDLVLMDLNYTGDTTSGRGGHRPARARAGARSAAAGGRDDRLGQGRISPSNPCAAAYATSCRSRGTTRSCSPRCDTRSRTVARDDGVTQAERASSTRRARSSERCCRSKSRTSTDGRSPRRGSRPPASAAIASTRFAFGDSRLALSIADVVGKGIPAALLMSNLQAAVRAFATDVARPDELCQQVNRILCGNIAEGRFISFFYCVLDARTARSTIRTPDTTRPSSSGRWLGRAPHRGRPGARRDSPTPSTNRRSVTVASGDRLVLFTDGITEARNEDDEEFGEERLLDLAVAIARAAHRRSRRVSPTRSRRSPAGLQDDATLIVLAADEGRSSPWDAVHVTRRHSRGTNETWRPCLTSARPEPDSARMQKAWTPPARWVFGAATLLGALLDPAVVPPHAPSPARRMPTSEVSRLLVLNLAYWYVPAR